MVTGRESFDFQNFLQNISRKSKGAGDRVTKEIAKKFAMFSEKEEKNVNSQSQDHIFLSNENWGKLER